MIARTFAWNRALEEIEQIDYFVIWEDESIPAARLNVLSNSRGEALLEVIEDLAAMLYAPAANALVAYLDDSDAQVRAAAAKAIGLISNPEILDSLVPHLTGNDPIVAKLLRDDSVAAEVRFHLVGALEFHGDPKNAGETFLAVLKDSRVSGELRNRLGYSLVQVADSKLVKGMIKQFKVEESQYVTLSLAAALNRATGNRRPISGSSPIAQSRPGMRDRYIESWQK
jgi:hypothetical protein